MASADDRISAASPHGGSPGARRRAALLLFLVAAALHLAQVGSSLHLVLTGNELSHLRLLDALVSRGTLEIDPIYADVSVHGGRSYSNKPPGYVFALAPFYAAFQALGGEPGDESAYLFLKVANGLLSAATLALFYLLLTTFRLSRAGVAFGTVAATAGTFFPAYSCLATSIPLSLLLLAGTLLAVRAARLDRSASHWRALALFLASWAVLVDFGNLFFVAPLACLVLPDLVARREVLALLPALLPAALLLGYNQAAFGEALTITYSHYQAPSYVAWDSAAGSFALGNLPRGLVGLTVSPSRGLFLLSPVTLLGLLALVRPGIRRRWDLLWLGAPVAVGLLALSCYRLWHGGHSLGYRHILPVAMILGAVAAFQFEAATRWGRRLALSLLGVSVATGVASFFMQLDPLLLDLSWKGEPEDVHADFYAELVYYWIAGL